MADNKKEQERAELHRVIWNIANDLRGGVDGWDFKQYVLERQLEMGHAFSRVLLIYRRSSSTDVNHQTILLL
jgi:hypothetical protein